MGSLLALAACTSLLGDSFVIATDDDDASTTSTSGGGAAGTGGATGTGGAATTGAGGGCPCSVADVLPACASCVAANCCEAIQACAEMDRCGPLDDCRVGTCVDHCVAQICDSNFGSSGSLTCAACLSDNCCAEFHACEADPDCPPCLHGNDTPPCDTIMSDNTLLACVASSCPVCNDDSVQPSCN